MSKQTDKSLFILSSMPRLYQRLLDGVSDYQHLGNRLISEIRAAHAFRQIEKARELSSLLINIPIKEYQLIAQYYLIWCEHRQSNYNAKALESLIEQTQVYKAKALFSRGAIEGRKGDFESAMYFYVEALRTQPSISEYIDVSRTIAVLKATEGFHKPALIDLENLLPLIKYAEPRLYFDFLNSYAVELNQAGRKEEARNVSKIVLASPFIHAYPEWRETGKDVGLIGCKPPHSFVFVESGVITKPEPTIEPESKPQPASVLSFPRLQEAAPPDRPDKVTPEEISRMSISEKRELIQAALNSGMIPESDYNKMIVMFGLLDAGPAANVIDLEDDALLDDIIVIWANEIDPEQLAAVMSALRDCDDKMRRNDIIDRIIRKAFEQSRICGLTEEEWRLEVECKLPIK